MTSIKRVAGAIAGNVVTFIAVTVVTTPSNNCLNRLRSNEGYDEEGSEDSGEVAHVKGKLWRMEKAFTY
jgi:hypothetical protein